MLIIALHPLSEHFGWPCEGPWCRNRANDWRLLGAGVLGDGLGALRDGVLGQLSGQEETDGGLDLPGGDGGALVVVRQAAGLGGDALEDVVDERVHDAHRLGGDAGVGVDLLQHLVDVDGVRFLPLLPLGLLVRLGDVLLGLARLLGGLSGGFGWHGAAVSVIGSTDVVSRFGPAIYCARGERAPHQQPPPVGSEARQTARRALREASINALGPHFTSQFRHPTQTALISSCLDVEREER
jgi:hypothetical protein